MSQESDFLVAVLIEFAGFRHYGVRVSAPFGSTGVRNNAIRTYIIASSHYGYEGGDAVLVHPDRRNVSIGLFVGQQHVYLRLLWRDGLK